MKRSGYREAQSIILMETHKSERKKRGKKTHIHTNTADSKTRLNYNNNTRRPDNA